MNPRTQQRAIAGGLIWIGLIAAVIFVARSVLNVAPEAIDELVTYAGHQRQSIELDTNAWLPLRPGDPIYKDGSDDAKPIGMVWSSKAQDDGATKVKVVMYANCPTISDQDFFEYREATDSVDWMLRTMFHDEKKAELKELIQDAIKTNQTELVEAFKPVIVESLKEANTLVRDDLRMAFETRKPQLTKLSQRYQTEVLEKKLLPVFQRRSLADHSNRERAAGFRDQPRNLERGFGLRFWLALSLRSNTTAQKRSDGKKIQRVC